MFVVPRGVSQNASCLQQKDAYESKAAVHKKPESEYVGGSMRYIVLLVKTRLFSGDMSSISCIYPVLVSIFQLRDLLTLQISSDSGKSQSALESGEIACVTVAHCIWHTVLPARSVQKGCSSVLLHEPAKEISRF